MSLCGVASPRLGLLGNPSDGYGGRVLSVTFRDFEARATWRDAPRFEVAIAGQECAAASLEALGEAGARPSGAELGIAAWRRWCRSRPAHPGRLELTTDIPRQAGLSGSSALILATLRVLARRDGHSWDPLELARVAWAVETEDLGITAGPQDRVVQAHEGLLDMDFSGPWTAERMQRLPVNVLPPLFVAWDPGPGTSSGTVHDDVRARYDAGDDAVREVMQRLPELVREGRRCLEVGDHDRFAQLMNENFDLRAGIWTLSSRDVQMIEVGRRLGAGVKFAGSGGAVVGVVPRSVAEQDLRAAYEAAGFAFLRPQLG